MHRVLLTIIACSWLAHASAQKAEYRISLNSGFFSYSGKNTGSTTTLIQNVQRKEGYADDPYGTKSALSYGLSAKMTVIGKEGVIVGADLGFEMLKSKIYIDSISRYTGPVRSESASGKIFLNSQFLNLSPFVGYRAGVKNMHIEFAFGFDIACCLQKNEKGKITGSDGTKYTSAGGGDNFSGIDFRPRLQVSAGYKKMGIYAGYSLGLMNNKHSYPGNPNKAFSRMFRFGMSYRLK